MRAQIAVTGVTGAVGGGVARLLAERGLRQRLLARDISKAPEFAGGEVCEFSFSETEATREALEGVDVLFMVSAAESEDRLAQHLALIDAASGAGVRHVVYTSFIGAEPAATFTLARDHYVTEEHVKASGMAYTFLRDGLYLDFMDLMVGADGVIRGPAGNGRVAGVARADVARVAATILTDPARHENRTYELTGSEALTLSEVARILSAARGTAVTYYDETLEEAYESRQKWGAPPWQQDAWVSTYAAIAAGEMGRVSNDVELITGLRPLSLTEVLANG